MNITALHCWSLYHKALYELKTDECANYADLIKTLVCLTALGLTQCTVFAVVCCICWMGMPDTTRCCKFHIHSPPRVSDSAERGKTGIDGRTSKQIPAIFWTTDERRLYFQTVLMLSDLPLNWLCCKNARKCLKKMHISQMIDRSRTRAWIDF